MRLKPLDQLKANKDKMFTAYHEQIAKFQEQLEIDPDDEELMKLDKNGNPKKQVKIKLDDIYEP